MNFNPSSIKRGPPGVLWVGLNTNSWFSPRLKVSEVWVLLALPNPAANTSTHSCKYEYALEAFSFWRSCSLSPSWEDTVLTASSDRAWRWSLLLWKWAAASDRAAPSHRKSPRKCKALVKYKSPLLPHQDMMWQFPLENLFRWPSLGNSCWAVLLLLWQQTRLCLKRRCWVGGLLWKGEVWGVSELSVQLILRNWFYFCLIPVIFIRRTASPFTAPGEIKLTEPIRSYKINRSGLCV